MQLEEKNLFLQIQQQDKDLSEIMSKYLVQKKSDKVDNTINRNIVNYTFFDFCAGIGSAHLAFKNLGLECNGYSEIDKKAEETYKLFHGTSYKNYGDLMKINPQSLEDFDILLAGFPCQTFSIAGKRKGFEDERGSLVFEVLRLVKEIEPQVLFLENVKNLISHNKGQTFKDICLAIESLGYFIKYKVLNTCEYSNLPQNRERVYIVCFKNKNVFDRFNFPEKTTEKIDIVDILEHEVDESFYYTKTKYYPELKQTMTNKNTCYQWRRQYVRENKSNLCPTLTANMGTGGHNVPLVLDSKDIRKLTPRECARLQGFSDDFVLPTNLPKSALYKQMGNSVSVPVIEKIAKNILLALNV